MTSIPSSGSYFRRSECQKTYDECAKLLPATVGAPLTLEEPSRNSREGQGKDPDGNRNNVFEGYAEDSWKSRSTAYRRGEPDQRASEKWPPHADAGVELYNHNGWFGLEENESGYYCVRLREMGVTGVGMVYNFSHARDGFHDDSKNFPELWRKMKDHVVAVNITGMRTDEDVVYSSQGRRRAGNDANYPGERLEESALHLVAEKGR